MQYLFSVSTEKVKQDNKWTEQLGSVKRWWLPSPPLGKIIIICSGGISLAKVEAHHSNTDKMGLRQQMVK